MMQQKYEYQVCAAQYGRVTFVNGAWQGTAPLDAETNSALESCPNVWDYLSDAGHDGWELVTVVSHPQPQPGSFQDMLYLKRPSW